MTQRWFLLLLLLAQLPGLTPAPTASIEGIVVKAGTTDPLPNVTVSLGGRTGEKSVVTGMDGRFTFRDVEPGPVFLSTSASGLTAQDSIPLTLKTRDNLKNVRLTMKGTGSISGKILDERGEPVVRAVVQAQRFSYRTGNLMLGTIQAVLSNDLGEYRLFWLPPGSYLVTATATDPQAATLPVYVVPDGSAYVMMRSFTPVGSIISVASRTTASGERIEEASLPVYFPGTTDSNAAARVEVRSGAHTDGIDIVLKPARGYRIRGRVVSESTGAPITDATVMLMPRHPDRRTDPMTVRTRTTPGGFEIPGVPQGAYFLVAQATGHLDTDTGSRIFAQAGVTAIEVGQANLDNVTIVVRESYGVTGRVLIDGQVQSQPATGGRAAQVVLRADGLTGEFPFESAAYIARDGSFAVPAALRGDFQVFVRNHTEIGYVRSIRLGAADGLNGSIRLDGPPQVPLEIVISPQSATLQGVVINAQREPVFNATVALVPEARLRGRQDLYLSVKTDAAGAFRISGITPGLYTVFAWEDVEQHAWLDPEFLRIVEHFGRPISFVESKTESMELNAIPYR